MAIYKNTSSKTIVRKIMRDLNPTGDNWVEDAIEWIGEALEHIGASPQLVTKTCVLDIKEYQAVLPNDLYYINQVAINSSSEAESIATQMDEIRDQLNNILEGENDYELNRINARLHVLESQYSASGQVQVLSYCSTNFPKSIHCENCVNENAVYLDCYYIDNDRIKTSFYNGKVCLSYTAFPLDDDCYPLVPDDISFKEAMFWYVYKKMLLGRGELAQNGIDYVFADQQWKYYCTQARNAANFPDIDRYEAFMNQWVRLIPNINRHDEGFANLSTRESLNRTSYDYITTTSGFKSRGAATSKVTKEVTSSRVTFKDNTVLTGAVSTNQLQLKFPQLTDIVKNEGSYPIEFVGDSVTFSNLSATTNIEVQFDVTGTPTGDGVNSVTVEVFANQTILETFTFNTTADTATTFSGVANNTAGDLESANIYLKINTLGIAIADTLLKNLTIKVG